MDVDKTALTAVRRNDHDSASMPPYALKKGGGFRLTPLFITGRLVLNHYRARNDTVNVNPVHVMGRSNGE